MKKSVYKVGDLVTILSKDYPHLNNYIGKVIDIAERSSLTYNLRIKLEEICNDEGITKNLGKQYQLAEFEVSPINLAPHFNSKGNSLAIRILKMS